MGKETFLNMSTKNLFKSDTKMSIGIEFRVKGQEIDGKRIKLEVWQFEGEGHFRFALNINQKN